MRKASLNESEDHHWFELRLPSPRLTWSRFWHGSLCLPDSEGFFYLKRERGTNRTTSDIWHLDIVEFVPLSASIRALSHRAPLHQLGIQRITAVAGDNTNPLSIGRLWSTNANLWWDDIIAAVALTTTTTAATLRRSTPHCLWIVTLTDETESGPLHTNHHVCERTQKVYQITAEYSLLCPTAWLSTRMKSVRLCSHTFGIT